MNEEREREEREREEREREEREREMERERESGERTMYEKERVIGENEIREREEKERELREKENLERDNGEREDERGEGEEEEEEATVGGTEMSYYESDGDETATDVMTSTNFDDVSLSLSLFHSFAPSIILYVSSHYMSSLAAPPVLLSISVLPSATSASIIVSLPPPSSR